MTDNDTFRCLIVRANKSAGAADAASTKGVASVESLSLEVLEKDFYPVGQSENAVTIDVEYSSLNYKDALGATGHPGVVGSLPMIPGIDAAGTVVSSHDRRFSAGQSVMIFHADFGTKQSGGYCRRIRVPGDWVYPLPESISARESMIYGTAGFTAAQSVDRILGAGIKPDAGEVLVTGATGGVGAVATMMLASLGYSVVAVTGKTDRHDWLKEIGAARIVSRDEVNDTSSRPLLRSTWAAAVDTVGGVMLANVLRSTRNGAVVTACGMVGGVELPTTVYPFILRGVTLVGIDSANITREERSRIWKLIGSSLRIENPDRIVVESSLAELTEHVESILASRIAGRVLVKMQEVGSS